MLCFWTRLSQLHFSLLRPVIATRTPNPGASIAGETEWQILTRRIGETIRICTAKGRYDS